MSQQNPPPGPPNPYGGPPAHAGPPQQQPSAPGGYGGPPQVPPPASSAPPPSGAPRADHDDNRVGFFRALFDVSFTHYATPSVVRVVYVLAIVLGVLAWLAGAFLMLPGGRGLVALLAVLLLGWIPVLLWISILRVGLELVLASVRTAENTRRLRENQGL